MAKKPKKQVESGIEVRTNCESCGIPLIVDARDAGRKATCPACGGVFIIPSDDDSTLREEPLAVKPRKLRLKQDNGAPGAPISTATKPPPPSAPSFAPEPAKATPPMEPAPLVSVESYRTRAQLSGWLRRVIIVVLALTVAKIFEAAFASMLTDVPANLHSAASWAREAIGGIPQVFARLKEPREILIGVMTPLERFMLTVGMLLYATRLMVRSKLLDAVFVTTRRWNERRASGMVISFMIFLIIVGLLAWTASVVKLPASSDGLACGLISLMLFISAMWLLALHLMASHEYPELTKWTVVDAVTAILILLVALSPGMTGPWSRAGATSVLFLANSAAALHVGASFVFARRARRWWWHKPLSIVISMILLFLTALLMACAR